MSDHGYIETYSGGMIDPLDPHPEQIDPRDICHALAHICRFTGHVREFYTVAQHSLLVADEVSTEPDEAHLMALLHDASEAYIADIARPVKPRLVNYVSIERNLMEVIAEHFRLPWPFPDDIAERIKVADQRLLDTERRDLMPGNIPPWPKDPGNPLPFTIETYGPWAAKGTFSTSLRTVLKATGRGDLAEVL